MYYEDFFNIKDWKEIVAYSRMISIDDMDIVDIRARREINEDGYANILAFQLDPYYAVMGKNSKYRTLEIEFGDDTVYLFFKHVSFMKAQYIRVIGYPVSLNNYHLYSMRVFNSLIERNLIKQYIEVPQNEDDVTGYNFYNDIEEINEIISKSKFRSKNGINKYAQDFRLERSCLADISIIRELNKSWQSCKKHLTDKRMVDGFLDYMIQNDQRLRYYTLWYKDIIIGFTFGDIVLNDLLQIVVNRNITVLDDYNFDLHTLMYKEELEERRKYLGAIHFYLLMKKLKEDGMKIAYIGGGAVSDKLLQYKSKFYKHHGAYKLYEVD